MTATVTTKLAGAYGGGSFPYAFLDLSGVGNGPFCELGAVVNVAGNPINPATEDTLAAIKAALLGGGITVSWSGQTVTANLGTLGGAATAAAQTTANTTLSSILAALQTARAETTWTDDTGAYYVRVDNGGTIAWMTPAGAGSAAPGTGIRPAAGASITTDKTAYQSTEITALGQLHTDLTSTPTVAPARSAAVDVSKTSPATPAS